MNNIKPTQQEEFLAVKKYWESGLGIDVGCGNNRLSPEILTLDIYPHKDADLVVDCRKLPFRDRCFDFVFSSHCLEDFKPEEIKDVFLEWLRVVKIGGYIILLLPDMEGGRYPKAGDKNGNPSHLVNVGINFMNNLVKDIPLEIVQCDTINHQSYFTFDFVCKKVIC
jgi:predicted SAM-dependent methyltransferase